MPEESYTFAQTRIRLEDIVAQVRKKDVSLEKSLDLLEEGVRLANQCTELIDHADWESAGPPDETGVGNMADESPTKESDPSVAQAQEAAVEASDGMEKFDGATQAASAAKPEETSGE